jgi:uncharacterized peroxidase-related enzyme
MVDTSWLRSASVLSEIRQIDESVPWLRFHDLINRLRSEPISKDRWQSKTGMAFFSFLDESSGMRALVAHNLIRYGPIRELRQSIMRGSSPFSQGERELIAAFVSRLNHCRLCSHQHAALAAQLGVDVAILEGLLASIDGATISDRLKPIFRFVKKLTEEPGRITQADADAVFSVGWSEAALEDAIAVCALFNMVNRLADGHGLEAPSRYSNI